MVAYLREIGCTIVTYLDDTLVVGTVARECKNSLDKVITLFRSLGFVVNLEKSQLNPSQSVRYLGFIINTIEMKLFLPQDKMERLANKCTELARNRNRTILRVAEILGTLISACPATKYGLLYTRQLEMEKSKALFFNGGNYNAKMQISEFASQDLLWWSSHVKNEWQYLQKRLPDLKITSDASPSGWGAEFESREARGNWAAPHLGLHINELELWAVYYGLNTFVVETGIQMLLRVDNCNAMTYINRFGGCRSPRLHAIAKSIWTWYEERQILLTASYINTKANLVAGRLSREKQDSSDFMLNPTYFGMICKAFGLPEIDLFASYHTKQCERYYSWKPDPFSEGVDAFSFPWKMMFYAFPPVILIGKVLNKIQQEKSKGILVVPNWPTQAWYPLFKRLATSEIITLGPNKNLLFDPYYRTSFILNKKLTLIAAVLSGRLL